MSVYISISRPITAVVARSALEKCGSNWCIFWITSSNHFIIPSMILSYDDLLFRCELGVGVLNVWLRIGTIEVR